jgi:hypothetical protein
MRSLASAMGALRVGALALIAFSPARAQQRPADSSNASTSAAQSRTPIADRLRRPIDLLRAGGIDRRVPPADSFTLGNRSIPPGSTVHGPVGVSQGTLEVAGRLEGDAFALGGDIIVHRGGVVVGDALSVGGRVILDGGRVEGEMRSLSGISAGAGRSETARAPLTTWQSVKLAIGWFAVLAIIGLGVMIFAEANLEGVVATVEGSFTKAFWYGVLGQLMALPVLLLLVLGLFITVLGILLIPFAVVSYCIAAAGLLTLGFLAAARITGSALVRGGRAASPRGVHLRALFTGLVLYFALWLLAAAFTWHPVAGAILRGIALVVTWVAATVGLGAALTSRAGTQRPGQRGGVAARRAPDDLAWQTPTPVTGVAAARRPVATVKDHP